MVNRIGAALLAERDRWPLWIPVGFGVGIAIYFALPAEPPVVAGSIAFAVGFIVWLLTRQARGFVSMISLGLMISAGGFVVAQARAL